MGLARSLKGQITIVGQALQRIRQRSVAKLKLPNNYSTFSDTNDPTLENELYRQLNFSAEHLQTLIRYIINIL